MTLGGGETVLEVLRAHEREAGSSSLGMVLLLLAEVGKVLRLASQAFLRVTFIFALYTVVALSDI